MNETTKPSPASVAATFDAACLEAGFRWYVKTDTLVAVTKAFEPGDRDAYVACDTTGPRLLAMLPTTAPGSVWGTDGATVGGAVGLREGRYVLNKSGIAKRVVTALGKL